MNRRGLLFGAIAAPAAITAVVAAQAKQATVPVFVCGTPQCSECLSVMAFDDDSAVTVKKDGAATVRCLYMRCKKFKKALRFAVPSVQALEE